MLSLPLTESGRYLASGTCTLGGETMPLAVHFRVLRQNSQLRLDGYYQAGSGEKHDFRLRLRFAASILAGGRFEYGDAHFKQLAGTLAWAQDCYIMAGHCYAPNASVSVYLQPADQDNHYALRALLSPTVGEPLSVALDIAPHSPRVRAGAHALEKVSS